VCETDIVRGSSVVEGVEGLDGGGLNLFNEDVSRSASHSLTFIVGDDGVVGPNVHVAKGRSSSNEFAGDWGSGRRDTRNDDRVVDNEEFVPVSEPELDSHFIVRKSSGGESDTRVSSEEVGEGKVEDKASDGVSGGGGLDEVGVVSDHIAVSNLFSSWDGESGPEVEEKVIQTSSRQVVEGDG
jgi:hypothetical protein